MADSFFTNLAPAATHVRWAIWKLTRAMVAAGYQIRACGNGTTFKVAGVSGVASPIVGDSADDLWTTLPGTSAWICLRHPVLGFEIVFWRDTTSDDNGKIIVGKANAFTTAAFASASATSPGTMPAGVGYFRGSSGAFSQWAGGASQAINKVQIGVKDVNGPYEGAWFMLGSTPGYAANTFAHSLRFSPTDPYSDGMGTDPQPYVFFGPPSATGTYGSYDLAMSNELQGDTTSGTSGYWWGWRADGAWSQFGAMIPMQYTGNTYGFTSFPTDPYSTGTKYFLDRVCVVKLETSKTERKGYVRAFRVGNLAIAQYDVLGALEWAKFGPASTGQWIVFWDGVTATPTA